MPFHLNHLPERTEKPRDHGITMVLDKGLSTRQAEDLCETSVGLIDMVKLGWGTSCVSRNLDKKLQIYRKWNIPVFMGGTLLEACLLRDQLEHYIETLKQLEIGYVEISDGTVRLSEKRKLELINRLSRHFTVLSEIGSKDPDEVIPPYIWVEKIEKELDAGSWKVICEARESGSVGVFRPNGEVRAGLIEEITTRISPRNLIFEAPRKEQQAWFVRKFGSNVNLGNIQPSEVIPVETLRLGLRSETLLAFGSPIDAFRENPGIHGNGTISQETE